MTELRTETKEQAGVVFHFIQTKKFKTIHLLVKSKALLNRRTITKRALLPYVLERGTKNYPTEKQLMKKLADLYGANFSIDSHKKGNYHIIQHHMQIANEKFIEGESNLVAEALSLLQEAIFDPLAENDSFDENIVMREKRSLENDIRAIYDEKVAFANKRLIEEMCKDELYAIATNGYIEDLAAIDGSNLYSYYQEVLQEDEMDVYVLGDFPVEEMAEQVMQAFQGKRSESQLQSTAIDENIQPSEMKLVQEVQAIEQTKLHLGYRTNCTYQDDDYFALLLMNGLFGGLPNSKLFREVREKHQLAYYATSRIESHKGLLIVLCGIDGNNSKQAIDIIQQELKGMQTGDFTEVALRETKDLILHDLKETLDTPLATIELLYQQVIGKRPLTIEQYIAGIKAVEKADVIRVAQNIILDTIYLLSNEEREV